MLFLHPLFCFLGNSGLYLQTNGSRLFFIFTTGIGLLLYVCLVHNIAVGLLTIYKSSIDFLLMKKFEKETVVVYKRFVALSVLILSYFIAFLSLVVTAIGALLSGNGYLFGLFVVFDSVLTIGNFNVLAYVSTWNEIGFVISVNLILLMGLSFLFTSVYVTFHFATGTDFNELIQYWWGQKQDEGYEVIKQNEEGPFQAFMDQSKGMTQMQDDISSCDTDTKNQFLDDDEETEYASREKFDSLTPSFLQQEDGDRSDQINDSKDG